MINDNDCGFSKGAGEYLEHSRRIVSTLKKKNKRLTDTDMSEDQMILFLGENHPSAREAISSLLEAGKNGNEMAGLSIFTLIDLKGIYGKELGDLWESSGEKYRLSHQENDGQIKNVQRRKNKNLPQWKF